MQGQILTLPELLKISWWFNPTVTEYLIKSSSSSFVLTVNYLVLSYLEESTYDRPLFNVFLDIHNRAYLHIDNAIR